jgi:hypothetical protein
MLLIARAEVWMRALIGLGLALGMGFAAGCGPDLPSGWEEAELVAELKQSPCGDGGSTPTGIGTGTGTGTVADQVSVQFEDPVHVEYLGAIFRCAQEVEAYALADGDRLDLLVQPVDMHPSEVARCDCAYDVTMDVAEYEGVPTEVRVFQRGDALNDPNDPVEVDTIAQSE